MKKIILTGLLLLFGFSLSFAQKNNVSISMINGKSSILIQDGKTKLNIKLKGEVVFTDDETGIKSLSSDGSISYKKGKNKLKITPEKSGSLLYVINGNKKTIPDSEDKSLIAECVRDLINAGINGKEREQAIYEKSGVEGVLQEVDQFESDYVKSIYLKALGANRSLTDSEMIAFLKKAETRLSSDYYKAEVLKGIRKNYLSSEATTEAYLDNVKSMESDYYQAEVLKKLWKDPLTEKQAERVLTIVKNMDSDYYQTEIITALLKKASVGGKIYSKALDAIQDVHSSYYQAEILKSLITRKVKDEKEWSRLIAYTRHIDSDYYKAKVLKKIAATMPSDETLKKEFEGAAKTLDSDYYYGSVMRSSKK